MEHRHILVVDNDPQIRRMMRTTLVAQGFEVDEAKSGDEALSLARMAKFDLVLLDVNMPGMSGIDVCRELRRSSDVGIIMLTVRSAEKDKTQAFDAGADDYVTKPFSTPELLARIRAAFRRKARSLDAQPTHLQLGDIAVDFKTREITGHEEKERLTPKEYDLLAYLASRPNQVVTHRELLREVWGPDSGDEKEYLRVFINRLRKKIERLPGNPEYLLTEPWVGYCLRLPK